MAVLNDAERARLDAAYRRTAYRVALDNMDSGPATLRVDMPWTAIDVRLTDRATCLAYLTAVNPGSRVLAGPENARRQQTLLADIISCGHSPLLGVAVADNGQWPDEPGFLVADLSLTAAYELAVRHGQNAFLHAQAGGTVRLIWCDVNKSMPA